MNFFKKVLKLIWEGENKWVTILFVITLLVNVIYFFIEENKENILLNLLNFLSAFFIGLTVSSFFEVSTRKELLKEVQTLFKDFIREVAVPQDKDLRQAILKYFKYLNKNAIPYEDERVLILKIKKIIEDKIVNFEIISKFKFNTSLMVEKEVKRTFTLVMPKYILSSLNIKYEDTKRLREFFIKKCILSSKEVNLEDILIKDEGKPEADIVRYLVLFKIPLTKELEDDNYHLQLFLNYSAPLEDYFVITFNTFCKKFRLEIHFENDTDKKLFLTIKPDVQNENPLVEKCNTGDMSSYQELECRNILPGTKFIIDWKRKKDRLS